MFNQFTEFFQASLEPMDKLVKLNISTANTVAHQQGLLIASLIDDGISFGQNISAANDVSNFIAEQSKFSADVQSQFAETVQQTSSTLTKAQKDAEIILGDSFTVFFTQMNQTPVKEQVVAPTKLIAEKPQSRAKTKVAAKAKVKAAPKAKTKAAPKAEVKAAPKAEVKAAPKAEVKAASKAEVKAAPKAELKAVPKAEVKAAPKAEVKAAVER